VRAFLILLALAFAFPAYAQNADNSALVASGQVINRSTVNSTATITTSGTFQTLLSSIIGASTSQGGPVIRQALTIENNNPAGPNCWVYIGPTASATIAASILLPVGGSYTRYWPFVPSDNIAGTCGANGTTIYVDYN